MKKIAILGSTGMLGSMVYKMLKDKYYLLLTYRDEKLITKLNESFGGVKGHECLRFDLENTHNVYLKSSLNVTDNKFNKLLSSIEKADRIINCTGIITSRADKDPALTYFINSAFPHILNWHLKNKLIHVTTDCVYSGKHGLPYTEAVPPSPVDLYGVSKSIGEPAEKSLVIRTSFIGPEIHGFTSLFEWFRRSKTKSVNGFTNHYWNGITTLEFGKILDKIISGEKKYPAKGIFHIYSTDLSKYELLVKFKNMLGKNIQIIPKKVNFVDRRLSSTKSLCKLLKIPDIDEQLNRLADVV